MLQIRKTTPSDFAIIQQLAHKTWPVTFQEILSEKQIAYMLNWMYSLPSLEKQVNKKGHRFLLALENEIPLGFASYELNYHNQAKTRIHKIYVLPEAQGKGAGRLLMNAVAEIAAANQQTTLVLNVNRFNKAVKFYKQYGFQITKEEDIAIGNGFLMEDFVMEKELK